MKCGRLAFLVLIAGPSCASADTPVIVRGAHADWLWTCAYGRTIGMACALRPYPVNAFEISLLGGKDLRGPYLSPNLTAPATFKMMMKVDDGVSIELRARAPESYAVISRMMSGRHLTADYVVPFTSIHQVVDVSLAGFKDSYCDALADLERHGSSMQPSEGDRERMPSAVFPVCKP